MTLLTIVLSDVVYRRVPNVLVLVGIAYGLCFWAAQGGMYGIGCGLAGALCIGLPLLPVYSLGLLGAADVKVGFACGFMIGADNLWPFVCAATISCLVLSVGALGLQEGFAPSRMAWRLRHPFGAMQRARAQRLSLPFTVCFGVGAVWASHGGRLWHL